MSEEQKNLHRAKILGKSLMAAGGIFAASSILLGVAYPFSLDSPTKNAGSGYLPRIETYYHTRDNLNRLKNMASNTISFSGEYSSEVRAQLENAFREEVEKKRSLEEAIKVQERELELICSKKEVEKFEAKQSEYYDGILGSIVMGLGGFLFGGVVCLLGSIYKDNSRILEERLKRSKQ